MQPMKQIHDIQEFEGCDTILIVLKADGSGETRVHVPRTTGDLCHHTTWNAAVGAAKARRADKINGIKHILVLLEEGVAWDSAWGELI